MATRVYCPIAFNAGTLAPLSDDAFNHSVRALRMQVGDTLVLFDGEGRECAATLHEVSKSRASVMLGEPVAISRASPLNITLLQGIAAADKMDWIIQKATELGVAHIVPIACERSVIKLSGEREAKRVEHWQRVAISACEQCGLNVVPTVHPPSSLATWLNLNAVNAAVNATTLPTTAWLLHPEGSQSLTTQIHGTAQAVQSTAQTTAAQATVSHRILIGPEGGLSPNEIAQAKNAGFQPVTIGPRVLRTETAGLAVIAVLQATLGDW
jgi:16S rRNA (uracil1498-N3)-methyltransferase